MSTRRRIPQSEIRNSATAKSEGGQKLRLRNYNLKTIKSSLSWKIVCFAFQCLLYETQHH